MSSEKEKSEAEGRGGGSAGAAAAVLLPVTDLSLQLGFAVSSSQDGGAQLDWQQPHGASGSSSMVDGELFSQRVALSSIPSDVRNESALWLHLHSNGMNINLAVMLTHNLAVMMNPTLPVMMKCL